MSVLKTFTVTGHIATAFVARFFSRTKAQQILDLRAQIFSVSCSYRTSHSGAPNVNFRKISVRKTI